MNKKRILGRFFAAIAVAFTLVFACSPSILAADIPDYRLQVSPTFVDIPDLKPGKTSEGTFKIENTGQKEIGFEINTSPYSVADKNYTIDPTIESEYTQISDWITVSEKSGTLPAGETIDIKYTIKVPSDAAGGGQYALINVRMVQDAANDGEASINAVKQIGFRVLSNVEGSVDKKGKIVEQNINSILFNPPITATSTVENNGNTHVTASYVLQVYALGGSEEAYTNEENPTTVTILPETQRFNSISWEGAPPLGIFRVKQTITIAGETDTYTKVVFLCPIWLLFIILLAVFLLIFWVVSRIRSRKN